MRSTQFAELSAFAAIAEQKSFAKAATLLGIGRSTLSQSLARSRSASARACSTAPPAASR
jgi:DNA-binding transcriptional regulator YdaS (Cro superfamily)